MGSESNRDALANVKEMVERCVRSKARQPSRDLEHLFRIGQSCDDWYQSVVASWASGLRVQHKVAPLKKPERALEKVERSYEGDPSRLLDIARSCIEVSSIEEARAALE